MLILKKNSSKGFTLIELLVSILIITTMTGLFLVNYHNTNKRSELNIEKQKLASNIRLAQNYSLGSKTYNGTNVPTGGWGVHFTMTDSGKYIIFADIDGDQAYDLNEAMETKTLPSGVTINSLSPAGAVDIIFLPPNPTVYINGLVSADAQIQLKENINNSTAVVTVNFFGLIDAD
ncbi:prepilin-type N-terminal cleavage/methylation domain-containing protein [Candidatus Falkowbacteria bacterium]|nr:prepilin-type N-terminal cleavage/methylation domain-containing protein [Candidatus Falkowbacteria bacterium]OIP79246.1 MAG: hypothetical protein AUK20_02305 [Parcubacteria group bacterium CG2_30_45_37]